MRAVRLAVVGTILCLAGSMATSALAQSTPEASLTQALNRQYHQLGAYSGAYVTDLTTGQAMYDRSSTVARLPASVQKLYTTSAALAQFGPGARITTSLLGKGTLSPNGTFKGTLYLRGAGDPTFGSARFDAASYGTGATVSQLAANLLRASHIRAIKGRILGDSSYLDGLAGTVASGYAFDTDIEGSLSALPFNRGLNPDGSQIVYPGAYAARQLAAALRADHVHVPAKIRIGAGRTPKSARLLAVVRSPTIAKLIALTNTPSDNFFAEMLAKDLGARFGTGGTTAAGVAVIRHTIATQFGLSPRFDDGSGLSRDDATTPRDVVSLLTQQVNDAPFVSSLAVGGETGTLAHEMVGTSAQGRCIGKTGTLHDVASLVGYCHALDGHELAFAFLANGLGNTDVGHQLEANMAVALAGYRG